VSGTSTLHGWDLQAEKMNAKLSADLQHEQLQNISSLQLLIEAQSLQGEKESMNEDAHEALKTDEYKYIQYDLQKVRDLQCESENCTGIIEGYLTIAGNRKPVSVPFQAQLTPSRLRISGEKELMMTYFGIEPPKIFLGLIRADNKVQVNYELVFQREE
jgi:polyisoprenoid-binding protein YceI